MKYSGFGGKPIPDIVNHAVFRVEAETNDLMEQFWRLESLGSKTECKHQYSEEEQALETSRWTIRNIDDHYDIGLPWKYEGLQRPNNISSALTRSYATESRFRKDREFARRYTKTIETNIDMGFARRLHREGLTGPYVVHSDIVGDWPK